METIQTPNINEPDPVNDNDERPVGSGNNDVLVWSEEFNYNGAPDPKIWTIETGNGDWGWGNGESQYYRSQNLNVSDGTLKITAKSENYGGFQYTSGRMKTLGKYNFKYGKAEIRAKLPSKSRYLACNLVIGRYSPNSRLAILWRNRYNGTKGSTQ